MRCVNSGIRCIKENQTVIVANIVVFVVVVVIIVVVAVPATTTATNRCIRKTLFDCIGST